MLKVYDILIGKDKPVVDVFFLNINDFLTGFCVQLDENSKRVMSATVIHLHKLQAQFCYLFREATTQRFKRNQLMSTEMDTLVYSTSAGRTSCQISHSHHILHHHIHRGIVDQELHLHADMFVLVQHGYLIKPLVTIVIWLRLSF